MKIGIIIPARYGSKRLEGKPLKKIGDKSMLERVVDVAKNGAASSSIPVIVATDDQRIFDHAQSIGVLAVMTDESCPSGTDRVYQAALRANLGLDFVINLQGDAPFTPPLMIHDMIQTIESSPNLEMITPAVRLSWEELDLLKEHKQLSPSSGTTVVVDGEGYAFWFSKNILPFLRNEKELRAKSHLSPVLRHVGMYGYSLQLLEKYVSWSEGVYEKIEGLEQLRALENGVKIKVIPVSFKGTWVLGGIDTEEDLRQANAQF